MSHGWWNLESGAATEVKKTVEAIADAQRGHRADMARFLSMYESRKISSMDNMDWATAGGDIHSEVLKENLIRSIIDTATAKIGSSRPRPRFLTSGAEWELQRRAYRRTLWVEGVYHENRTYQLGRRVFQDCGIFGNGYLHPYPDVGRSRVAMERVLAHELLVDFIDGKYGKPRSIFRVKTVARSVAQARWPKSGAVARDATMWFARDGATDAVKSIEDPITVVDSIHLPSGPDASDGMRIVTTDKGELARMDYDRERFPYAEWRWKWKTLGFAGMGLAEDVMPQQNELDNLDMKIQRMLWSMAIRAWLPIGAEVLTDQITNDPDMPVAFYKGGQRPDFNSDPGPGQELFLERERVKASAFEQTGISQMSATANTQPGVESGAAQRELKKTQHERFLNVEQDWDVFLAVDLPERCLDAGEDLAAMLDDDFVVRTPSGDSAETVKWSEIKGDKREEFQIQPWPAALLPREPAGRVAAIEELIGVYPAAAPLLAAELKFADVDSAMSLVSAPVEAILADIDLMRDGKRAPLEPFIDFETAKRLVMASYLKARNNNAPEAVLAEHRSYLLSVQGELDKLQEQAIQQAQQLQAASGSAAPQRPQLAAV
jgi:hypothetical protein